MSVAETIDICCQRTNNIGWHQDIRYRVCIAKNIVKFVLLQYCNQICQCCKARYADYQIHYHVNSNYAFCGVCDEHHKKSPGTGKAEHHRTPLDHPLNSYVSQILYSFQAFESK